MLTPEDLQIIIICLAGLETLNIIFNEMMMHILACAAFIRDDIVKVPSYFEEIVPEMVPDKFIRTFRMQRDTITAITDFLRPPLREHPGGSPQTDAEKMVAMTAAYLGSKDTIFKLSHLFGVTEDTFLRCTDKVMQMLLENTKQIVHWPKKEDFPHLARQFDLVGRYFPNVIGAMDGLHLRIKLSEEDAMSYYNYKKFHSIHLLATCTADRMFINAFVGWPGRSHDNKVFKESPLYENIRTLMATNDRQLQDSFHIVADSAFTCSSQVLTPYKNLRGGLDQDQRKYNQHLSSKRQVIERAFELLGRRFPRTLYLNQLSLGKKIRVAMCCVLMHNLCIMSNDIQEFLNEPNAIIYPPAPGMRPAEMHGNLKRDLLKRRVVHNI